jgi:CubicO group peptidase (beta-lactamase class C family)
MRRFWIVLVTVLIVVAGLTAPRALSVSASGHSHSVAAQKKCKKGYHRVHGTCKRKHAVAPTPVPTATPILDFPHQVDAYLHQQHFSGSVLIASKGEVLVSKGYGMADREHSVANTPQTQFRIGHSTKQFTAMAILLLQAQEKLTVNDPICTYLSACPGAWKPITIHELLNQSSGIPDIDAVLDAAAAPSPQALIDSFETMPLNFSPGTQFGFSDVGYVILSAIIAKVSGEPYETFMQQRIFDPLHMASTGFNANHGVLPHGAIGIGVGSSNPDDVRFAFPNAAYGMYSTVEDLFRWDEALAGAELSDKSWGTMFTPYEDITAEFSFPGSFAPVGVGYGWFVGMDSGRRLVFYDDGPGDIGSIRFEIYNGRYLDDKVSVIVLGNQPTSANQKDIGAALAAMVFARH